MYLRDVQPGDVDAYVAMRCDPVMMSELGGPLPREGIEAKVLRDVDSTRSGEAWITMIVPDDERPEAVAGSVVLWSHDDGGEPISEIGWMVLPAFQRQGIGKRAVRLLLERARDAHRWGRVHAFPGVSNVASNGICRSVGFTLLGRREVDFNGRLLSTNHWVIDPETDLA